MFNDRRVGLALVLLLGGCGNHERADIPVDGGADATSDAAAFDAAEIDAPKRTFTQYVLDRALLPATQAEADAHAFDLDGDTVVDNHVAKVLAEYASMGFQNQFTSDVWFARGETLLLAQLGAEDLTSEADATFTLYQGADPMPPACAGPGFTNCGKHLTGTGSFSLKAGGTVDPPLAGTIANGTLTAGPAHLTVQFSIGFSPPITVTLVGARVEMVPTATRLYGKVGGAITQAEIASKVIPALRESFAAAVDLDCNPFGRPPACDCAPGSLGEKVIRQLDTSPASCGVSLAEVENDATTAALLAPDVIVEGQPALSIGFGVSAVRGSFPTP